MLPKSYRLEMKEMKEGFKHCTLMREINKKLINNNCFSHSVIGEN
jgi:hypothetical protein